MIETFTNSLLSGDNLAPKTVKDILMVLHSVLRFASKRCSQTFPQVEISYPKEVKSQMRVLTREEQDHFIRYLLCDMDSCKFGVLLALLTGMRIGELCALRWENVSMEDRTIRISSTMQRLKNTDTERQAKTKVVIGTPKSSNSVRVIPMSNNAAKLCEKMRPADDTCFLLTGQPDFMEPRTLQYRMKRYTSACSLKGFISTLSDIPLRQDVLKLDLKLNP